MNPPWSSKRIPAQPPKPRFEPIVWAVWLGANTAHRLAREWRISLQKARGRLQYAADIGLLRVDRRHSPLRYSAAREVEFRDP